MQTGDPTGTGRGGTGYKLKAEFNDVPHTKGILAMARATNPDSADSQFYFSLGTLTHLDGQYTVFGKVTKGMDIVHSIGKVRTGPRDRPGTDVVVQKVTIVRPA